MTDGYDGGASGGWDPAHHALRELVTAATVRIHRTGVGYAPEESGAFLGSGFFVAPNWVLTCAHVIHGGEGGEVTVIYQTGPYEEPRAVPGKVAATLPEQVEGPVQGSWPAPDLALVRLREPVDHACVYLSERPMPHYTEGRVFYAGWAPFQGRPQPLDGFLTVHGTIGGWSASAQMRLGANELPLGVSGGPVIDPVRGEVVGVLKSRSDHGPGGTSIGIERLRTLPVAAPNARPHDLYRHGLRHHDPYQHDLYQAVCHAHDRHHRDRQQPSDSGRPTWTDLQAELGARPGRTLSPHERVELLGRLADLPPPDSTRGLLDILHSLPGFRLPTFSPAPRGWRDGLGALYENVRHDGALRLVTEYAMRVMTAERPVTPFVLAAEQALWEWIRQAATRLDSDYRSELARRRALHLGDRPRVRPGRDRAGHRAGEAAAEAALTHRTGDLVTHLAGSLLGEEAPSYRTGEAPGAEVPAHRGGGLTAAEGRAHPRDIGLDQSVLLEVEHLAWNRDRCDWSVAVLRPDGEVTRLDDGQGAPLADLAAQVAGPLAEAFRRCDEPDRPVPLHAALPHLLLDLPVDEWRLRPGAEPLGAERPVVVRCKDRDQLPGEEGWYDDEVQGGGLRSGELDGGEFQGGALHGAVAGEPGVDEAADRRARWHPAHPAGERSLTRARAEILDCDDAVRRPVSEVAVLRGLAPGTVPVLCRQGDLRYPDDATALGRIVRAGYGVVLWRRWSRRTDSVCGEFHRGARMTVDDADGAWALPDLVHGLRKQVREGLTEAFWAKDIALLYDDPHRPLPGTGDLLEAP
ncbi:trypsin-like peptidase domain-containing protein [Streptomyces sp. NPDC006654]|uniref:VMAP-C domain-containing protein n=1 Tax=Streptomyces sp. NPDC006654 TaxID=3156897 RepID=UPI00340424DF